MRVLESSLTSQVHDYGITRELLSQRGFALGGNWEYDHGSFDCALDENRQVWLRLPFDVTAGKLDGEAEPMDTEIRFGQPFVLKHVYQEGLDDSARAGTLGGLINQFSDPADPDDEIGNVWIEKARRKLDEVEALYPRP
ncbi:YugN family protein [Cohnella hongkongensis]|uniref:YugN family protein n=1 Tax=Cohnella hongkongensis TaxID=178337 RepID=A0ABV9FCB6_9BACL